MDRTSEVFGWQRLVGFAGLLAIVFSLEWAEAFFVPVALSLLLTFLLTPAVKGLEWLGLGRILSVLLVVILSFSILIGIGVATAFQFSNLIQNLPQYTRNVRKKVSDLAELLNLEKVRRTIEELEKEAGGKEGSGGRPAADGQDQDKVVVVKPPGGLGITSIPGTVGSALEPLASVGMVIVLVVFMLIQREDIRNRVIRLIGHGHLATTTKALDEGAQRISRYLLMQSVVNGTFGLGSGLGLFIIGLPYALLWGLLSALLRFIPYVGAWLTAFLAFGLSLAVFPGWTRPLAVIGLIAGLEVFINAGVEPLLYSRSAGVSQVALLLAVAFWTWLWGPVGLLLATPLTVCLVVLGRYVPHLEFLSVLLGDEPVMNASAVYYQRLLAGDHDEAMEVVEEYLASHREDRIYDDLLLLALVLLRKDRANLAPEDERSITRFTREVIEQIAGREPREPVRAPEGPAAPRVHVLGCPARDEVEELGLFMLGQVLVPERFELELMEAKRISLELLSVIETKAPPLVCIAALPHGGFSAGRYLTRRLRKRFPGLRIVVGHWGLEGNQGLRDRRREAFLASGADRVSFSIIETRDQIRELAETVEGAPSTVGVIR